MKMHKLNNSMKISMSPRPTCEKRYKSKAIPVSIKHSLNRDDVWKNTGINLFFLNFEH
jgi:hypothetical protein